jgi:hypothetical protein
VFSHVLKNVDSLNAELHDLILERERTTPSAAKSNIGGWQSEADFLTWGGSAVSTLGRYLATAVAAGKPPRRITCGHVGASTGPGPSLRLGLSGV